eukprot:SAG11_NODE_22149_length_411_cov_0.823718_1_plen_132_part_10
MRFSTSVVCNTAMRAFHLLLLFAAEQGQAGAKSSEPGSPGCAAAGSVRWSKTVRNSSIGPAASGSGSGCTSTRYGPAADPVDALLARVGSTLVVTHSVGFFAGLATPTGDENWAHQLCVLNASSNSATPYAY